MTAEPMVIGHDDVSLDEWGDGLDLASPPNRRRKLRRERITGVAAGCVVSWCGCGAQIVIADPSRNGQHLDHLNLLRQGDSECSAGPQRRNEIRTERTCHTIRPQA
jgi:hypothetical protein